MRKRGLVAAGMLAGALLAGCTPAPVAQGDPDAPPPQAEPTATSTPAPTDPVAVRFRMPDACDELITTATADEFAAAGLALLGGPGTPYFADPTPEERVGGVTCVWGDESDPSSTLIVSVAPLTPAARPGVEADLAAQGLNQSAVDGAVTYAQIGDDVSAPGVLNVLRAESWISVIAAVGGEERFERATELVDEITSRVYVPA